MKKIMKVLVTALISTLCTFFTWMWWNDRGYVFGKEELLMKWFSLLSLSIEKDYSEVPEDFIFINTANDLQLAEATEDIGGVCLPIGNAAITDRDKLARLLNRLSESPVYKYIFFDILIEKQYATPSDSALAMAINSTPRLVYASFDTPLIDGLDPEKAGKVSYTTTMINGDFCKYNLLEDNNPSMVYKAYIDAFPNERHHIPQSFMPVLYFNKKLNHADSDRLHGVFSSESQILHLGVDALNEYADISKTVKDKYIFIGVMDSYDSHTTYLDKMDGIQIHANALLNLLKGNHTYHPATIAGFFLVILTFYLLLFYKNMKNGCKNGIPRVENARVSRIRRFLNHKSVRFILSFVTIDLIFSALFYFHYLATSHIVEVTSLSLLFTLLWNLPLYTIYSSLSHFFTKLMNRIKAFRFIIFAFLIGIAATAYGETFKILYISAPNYVVSNNVKIMAGDTISLNNGLDWANPNQAMRVQSLKSGAYMIIKNSPTIKGKNLPLKDFIKSAIPMAGRGDSAQFTDAFRAAMPDTLMLLDKFEMPTVLKQDSTHFFFIEYVLDGEIIKKKLPVTEGIFTIDRGIYTVDGIETPAFNTPINIFYYNKDANSISIIGENNIIMPMDL